jgi:hypothetical protein
MEALCFRHYLTTGSLLSYKEACSAVPGGINLTVSDYILGVFDFVGEVMRFGITMVALTSREENGAERILMDLRRLREEFEGLDTYGHGFLGKEVDKKMTVMKTCVEKVRFSFYATLLPLTMFRWRMQYMVSLSVEARNQKDGFQIYRRGESPKTPDTMTSRNIARSLQCRCAPTLMGFLTALYLHFILHRVNLQGNILS